MARLFFRRKKDLELRQIHANGELLTDMAERNYAIDGGISTDLAQRVSDAREEMLVARAVGRERRLSGGDGSHQALGPSFDPNPKKEGSLFGKLLRFKRGAER